MDGASTAPATELDDARARPPAPRPSEAGRGPATLPQTARRLARGLWPWRSAIAGAVGCFFVAAALEPLVPALLKYLLDHGFAQQAPFPLWIVPLVVVGIFLVRGAASFGGAYLFAWASSKAVLDLRRRLVGAIMQADSALYTVLSPGVATARVINEPQNAFGALSQAITTLLRDGIGFVVLLGYLFWLDWMLTLVALAVVPLVAVVMRRIHRRVVDVSGRTYASQVRLTGIIDDIARAWRVVRTFDAQHFEQRRFDEEAARLRAGTVKSVAAGAMLSPLTQVTASVGIALILTLALWQARRGAATVGEFVAFITALLMTSTPLRRLTDITQPIVGALIQARACFELLDTPPEPDTGTLELGRARGEIELRRLRVVHPGAERPALFDVDLTVNAGETVALVGPSGAGKTTLVNALLGFVEPDAGALCLDGHDLRTLRKGSLRRQFAVVSQDIVLFDASIEENVAYALPLDPGRIAACLEAAQLGEFVAGLPEGARTRVGTNGNRLSGGQRQRLAIARALYKDAPVWIFDEATSALDSESERGIQAALERQRGARTLLLIAHRLSTIRHADRIHVLVDGRRVESGDHESLMHLGGRYAAMVRAQAMD
jgi:subfamily B ATP-binding cassette protein MsbA